MFKFFLKFFSKYHIIELEGGTMFIPVFKRRSKNGVSGRFAYYGITKDVPDLQQLALTTKQLDKKLIANQNYGYYIGNELEIENELKRSSGRTSKSDAIDAIKIHKEFVKFKHEFNRVKIVKYA